MPQTVARPLRPESLPVLDTTQSNTELNLRDRIDTIGSELQRELGLLVDEVVGRNARPIEVARRLSIDNSTASRLMRAVRAPDSLRACREIPAPEGLRMVLSKATQLGLSERAQRTAEAAIDKFVRLLAEFPARRTGLDAAIESWVPSARAKTERAARQAAFKSMSQLFGFSIDINIMATVVLPGANPRMCDSLAIQVRDGLRRLRAGGPILLFGQSIHRTANGAVDFKDSRSKVVETLDGEREVTDARKFLLPDFGNIGGLPMRIVERPTMTRFVLDTGVLPVNVPATVGIAQRVRNTYFRYQEDGRSANAHVFVARSPIRLLVVDLLIHEDLFPGFTMNVDVRRHGLTMETPERDEELIDIDRIDMAVTTETLGRGLDGLELAENREYPGLIRSIFAKQQLNPAKFRTFRATVLYPIPYAELWTWFELPPLPEVFGETRG